METHYEELRVLISSDHALLNACNKTFSSLKTALSERLLPLQEAVSGMLSSSADVSRPATKEQDSMEEHSNGGESSHVAEVEVGTDLAALEDVSENPMELATPTNLTTPNDLATPTEHANSIIVNVDFPSGPDFGPYLEEPELDATLIAPDEGDEPAPIAEHADSAISDRRATPPAHVEGLEFVVAHSESKPIPLALSGHRCSLPEGKLTSPDYSTHSSIGDEDPVRHTATGSLDAQNSVDSTNMLERKGSLDKPSSHDREDDVVAVPMIVRSSSSGYVDSYDMQTLYKLTACYFIGQHLVRTKPGRNLDGRRRLLPMLSLPSR